jgi:hypothetical protein
MAQDKNQKEEFVNPIDKDKITENPSGIAYAHNLGSALIKPEDMGKVKSRAYQAMEQQTQTQLKQIYDQIEVLAKQAKSIQNRVTVSTLIYKAEMKFEPLINKQYHLYLGKNNRVILAVIGPTEWGKSIPYEEWIATVEMMADHTWNIIDNNDKLDLREMLNIEDES